MATTNVDILVSTKGVSSLSVLDKKLQGSAANASKLNTALNGLKGAAAGLAGLAGLAIGVGAAFDQIKKADAAAAALRSIGADTKELIPALTKVRQELNNNASQAELTKSAFEVLQAGFKKTSDVTAIVGAATTAAKAKLADTGVVTKALTAVLNSYGIEASKAGEVTNKFFKTIKDGNLTIEEYSNVIGRLTPLGAAAGVELAELNAALAKVTQTGQNAAETSTGIAAALKALIAPSAEAKKLASELGLEFGLSAVRSKGFGGALKDVIDKTGGNTEQLQKLFGSIEALRVVLALAGDDFEGFDKVLAEQKNGLDAVKKAFDANADTIAGSLTRVSNAFTGLLTSGSGLARVLIPVFDGIAAAISALQGPIGVVVGILGGLTLAIYAAAKAWAVYGAAQAAATSGGALTALAALGGGATQVVTGFTAAGAAIMKTVVAVKAATVAAGALKIALLALPWVALAAGVAALGKMTFDYYKKQADLNRLLTDTTVKSTELKDAVAAKKLELEAAAGKLDKLRESSTSSKRALEAQRKKVEELRRQLEALEGTYNVRVNLEIAASQIASDVEAKAKAAGGKAVGFDVLDQAGIREAIARANGTYKDPGAAGGGGSSGGGGGGGGSAATDDIAALERQFKLLQDIGTLKDQQRAAELSGNQLELLRTQNRIEELELLKQQADTIAGLNTEEGKALQTRINALELEELRKNNAAEVTQLLQSQQEAREAALQPLIDEQTYLQDIIGYGQEEADIRKRINELMAQAPDLDRARVEEMVRGNAELSKQAELVQKHEQMIQGLAQGVASDMTSAVKSVIDGTKDIDEAFADMLKSIANRFLDMAMKLITDALTQQLMSLFGSLFGGGATGGFGGGYFNPMTGLGAAGPNFGLAEGGYITSPTQAMIGEAGEPEYAIPASKMNSAMARYNAGMRGDAVVAGASEYGSGDSGMMGSPTSGSVDVSYNVTSINSVNYVTEEQFRAGMAQATTQGAKQGEARTLGRLRTSVGVRRKLGMS